MVDLYHGHPKFLWKRATFAIVGGGSRETRGKITISGIANRTNYCVIYITNMAAGWERMVCSEPKKSECRSISPNRAYDIKIRGTKRREIY